MHSNSERLSVYTMSGNDQISEQCLWVNVEVVLRLRLCTKITQILYNQVLADHLFC